MLKVVFMGTPDFAVPSLLTLIQNYEVIGVITQPDRPAGRGRALKQSPVKSISLEYGLPVYQPVSLKDDTAIDPVREWSADIIIVAAFGQILPPKLLNLPRQGCLNVHASLLPRWRGAAPIQYAILSGDDQSGVSLMRMDEGLDTGPVYVQEAVRIQERETAESLHDRLAQLGADMLASYLDQIISGALQAKDQDDTEATYAPMLKKNAGLIDWNRPVNQIDRHIRAMTPWPSAYTFWKGKRLKLMVARPVEKIVPGGDPGLVVSMQGTAGILTSDGVILIERLQLAGKKEIGLADFLRGYPDFIGSNLPD